MQVKCLEITSAIKLLKDSGNITVAETVDGWTKVKLDINMAQPLTQEMQDKILSEVPGLKYWEYKGSLHNPSGKGFICEKHEISITFPIQ